MQNIDPALNFYLGISFFIILSAGLLIDIIIFAVFWDRLPKIFKMNLGMVPWVLRDVLKICGGLMLIYLAINLSGYVLLKYNPEIRSQLKHFVSIIGSMSMYCLGIWFILHFLKINYRSGLKNLGIIWTRWRRGSFKGIVCYLGFIPVLVLLTSIGLVFCGIFGIDPEPHPLVDILKKERSLIYIYYLVITAVIIAPVFEEILFRGLFYQSLKKRFGFFTAAITSSVFFSFLHFNTAQFLPVLGLGVLFCFVFEYTGSLIPSIILHILNNGFFLGLFFVLKEYL